MVFRVNPQALLDYAATTHDLAGQAGQAGSYSSQYLAITSGQGNIFVNVVAQAEALRQTLEANYSQMTRLLEEAGAELDRSADLYQHTDNTTAGHLDASYPPGR